MKATINLVLLYIHFLLCFIYLVRSLSIEFQFNMKSSKFF